MIDIKAIRAAAADAMQSEWLIQPKGERIAIVSPSKRKAFKYDSICDLFWCSGSAYGPQKHEAEDNAKHIATANPATILALLDRLEAAEKDAARYQALAEPAVGPVAKAMTAHRAAYFMERFKKEEKLLGPNEQAAVDFVIDMLTATHTAPPPPAEHSCKWPTCQTEKYQQDLAAQLARELIGTPANVPLLNVHEILGIMRDGNNCNYNDEAEHVDFARAVEHAVRQRVGL